jgi:hypothetical protein
MGGRERLESTNDNEDAVERVLSPADIALFEAVQALCGTGIVRDRNWWEIESARLGTDWPGIYALRRKILEELTAKAIERWA